MSTPIAWIAGVGARGPLGLSAEQIAMCVRAGKMEPVTTRFVDRNGEEIAVCRAACVPDTVHGYDRLLRLAAPALCEAWPVEVEEPMPVILALPEKGRTDDDTRFDEVFLQDLARRSGRPFERDRSLTIRAGHAGFAIAMEAAIAMMSLPGGPSAVVVGGVDSYYHPAVLADLDATHRLHAPGVEDGFIPSEGAAFVRITRRRDRPAMAAITRVVTGVEATFGTDEAFVAAGLTTVMRAVREAGPIRWILSDNNGEAHRARELALIETRVIAGDGAQVDEPIGEIGDVGAASGPTLAAIACVFFEAGCARESDVVIALSSDGKARGAVRLEAVT